MGFASAASAAAGGSGSGNSQAGQNNGQNNDTGGGNNDLDDDDADQGGGNDQANICHFDEVTWTFVEIAPNDHSYGNGHPHHEYDVYAVPADGCGSLTLPTRPEPVTMPICHLENGSFVLTTIDVADEATHVAHGDKAPVDGVCVTEGTGGETPGGNDGDNGDGSSDNGDGDGGQDGDGGSDNGDGNGDQDGDGGGDGDSGNPGTDPGTGEPDDGGEAPGGETPGGETPGGETPGGETPGGETPGGDNPGNGGGQPDDNPDDSDGGAEPGDNPGEQPEGNPAVDPRQDGDQPTRPTGEPIVKGKDIKRPTAELLPTVVRTRVNRPATKVLPATGAEDHLGIFAGSGLALVLLGGMTLAGRRRTVRIHR